MNLISSFSASFAAKALPAILSVLMAMLSSIAMASPNYRFTHITGSDGLPCQQVNSIVQDHYGRIWIGTRNGLTRYDGNEMTTYYHEPNDSNSLSVNTITSIFQDRKKRIWVGTYSGICLYQPGSDNFKRYAPYQHIAATIQETRDGRIVCGGLDLYVYNESADRFDIIPRSNREFIIDLTVDDKNRIFISTNTSIFYYNSTFTKSTQLNPQLFSDFLTGFDGIVPLRFDSKGYLWVGRNGKGVMRVNLSTGDKTEYDSSKISDGTVRVITEDYKHRIWLGTEKGVTIIHPNDSIEILRQNFTDRNGLNDNAVYDIMCDKNNNIWIGTYFGGINLLLRKNEQFQWLQPGYGKANTSGKAVRQIVEVGNGSLWIATEDGGLDVYDTSTGEANVVTSIPNLGSNIHSLLYEPDKRVLWIGTFRHGLTRYNMDTRSSQHFMPSKGVNLPSDAIFAMARQRTGRVWIGTTQGLRYYDEAAATFHSVKHDILQRDFTYCLLIDRSDNVWAGTRNNGLFRIDAKTGEIEGWGVPTLNDNYVICLYQDQSGRLWIGSDNGGLQYIDTQDMRVHTFKDNAVFTKGGVCGIVEDKDKRLWVTTNHGLYCIDRTRTVYTRYTIDDGLPTSQFNFSSAILARNERIYLGSINGLISFNPMDIVGNQERLSVYLKRLTINNEVQTTVTEDTPLSDELNCMSEITLSHDQARSFSIEYAAISPGNANSIYYQTRLLGFSDEWSGATQEHKFVGSNLPAGTYTFQIRATMSNSDWEKAPVKSIVIVIKPPFYESVWAYIIYFAIILVIIYFMQRYAATRLREKNEVRLANMEKAKIEEVNKIKLDFFTTVSHELRTPLALIMAPLKMLSQDKKMPVESTDMLATAIKNTEKMVGLIDELVTFNKVETGTFKFYLQHGNPLVFIEKITHLFHEGASAKNISLNVYCENNGEDVWFSPSYVERIMNNLLSNALKFTSEGGTITVSASITEREGITYLHIEVKDTGIGIAKEELQNIFNAYYQTKRGHTKNHKGWGLGLSLVKKLAEIHNGSVAVESIVGEGSTFIVDLNTDDRTFDADVKINSDKTVVPVQNYEFSVPTLANAKAANDSEDAVREDAKPAVLLVEDNEEMLGFLTSIFKQRYNIFTAENGQLALDTALKNSIDLVISDVMMPVMDGVTLCKKLKGTISTSHIPVVLLTAKNDAKDIMEGYESGADAYVQKPFDPQILELQVNNIIKDRSNLRERMIDEDSSSKTEVEGSQLSSFDKEFINRINELIDSNMENEDFSVMDITTSLGVSRSLLHVKMKSLLNISAGDYIRKKRMNRACLLLKEGYNVSETSYRTGFSEPNYFSKVFKKELGVSPTEWIAKNRGK